MQLNVFFVELLGDQKLSGVLIPVVIDIKNKLDDDLMVQIAKIFNSYRTVYVKDNRQNQLITKVYSTRGQVEDCLYANVATVFTLAESSYIRETGEEGSEEFHIKNDGCQNTVKITYQDMEVVSIDHKFDLEKISISDIDYYEDYEDMLITLEDGRSTRLINTKNSNTFSKIRKSTNYYKYDHCDYLVCYYKDIIDTAFFYVHRAYRGKDQNRLESKRQISLILSYLIEEGKDPQKINNICHVLNTGQYSIIKLIIKDGIIHSTMDARNMVAGILDI